MSRVILLLVLLAAMPRANAQEPLPTVRVTFYSFRYAPGLKTIYLKKGKGAYHEVKLSTANMVGPYKAVATKGAVTLHTMATNEEGETIYPKVGVAKIPADVSRALIVLAPLRKKGTSPGYQTLVLDRRDTKFPNGSYKLVNLSPYPIRGLIGKGTKFNCPASRVAMFKTKGEPGESLPVLFQFRSKDRWRRLTETRWAHSENGRVLLCAFLDQSTNRMKLRSIPDNTTRNKQPGDKE